jgi:FMN phosphatase YigB (HAD superfamily)
VQNGSYSPLRQTYNILHPRMSFGEFVMNFEKAFMTKPFEDQSAAFEEALKALGLQPRTFMIDKLIGVWNTNRILAKLFPETEEVLKQLKERKLKLGLISNTDSFAQQVIERFQIDKMMDSMALSFQTGFLKTDLQSFEKVLKDLNVNPDEAVMVGDSLETDMQGAKNANIRGILIDREDKRTYSDKIKSLKQLLEIK